MAFLFYFYPMKFRSLLVLLLLAFFAACRNTETYTPPETKPVGYSTGQRSPLFHEKNIGLQLDSGNYMLFVSLDLHLSKEFPFPIQPEYHDTLRNTAFEFEFLEDGKPVLSDYNRLQKTLIWQEDSLKGLQPLRWISDTVDIEFPTSITFKIPYYAFHHLKKGKHRLELKMAQQLFTDELYVPENNETGKYIHLNAAQSLLSGSALFDLDIPAIYRSEVYGYGLQLKNDSTFSPAGMDNTIWNSSYPDIYWNIYYPKDVPYTQTDYQKSTDRYEGRDTFCLYHYYREDSIGIGVFDHDNLSRDDVLGYWYGATVPLQRKPLKRISFSNIKWFDLNLSKPVPANF